MTALSRLLRNLVLSLVLATGLLTAAPADAREATDFLRDLSQRATKELAEDGIDAEERERRFFAIANETFDTEAIARFVLGVYWRRATPQEREDFRQVTEEIMTQRFLPTFENRQVGEIAFGRERPVAGRENQWVVTSTISPPGSAPFALDWRVRKEDDGSLKVVDIVAEGVSMLITLRQEYGSVVKRLGSVEALTDELRQKLAQGAFNPES